MATSSLKVSITAVDKASANLKKVGKHLGAVGKIAGGIGLAKVGGDLIGFAKSSVAAFENAGKSTMKLQRFMGGTVEDASRLGHALAMSGLDTDQATKSLGIFSKKLEAGGKGLNKLGVQTRDASGNLRPMESVLLDVADRFAGMENGPEKTALALSTLGKSGADMLPFLSKGSDGIRELMSESDRLGTTLSGKDLAAVKANVVAKRRLGEAIKGVSINMGRFLYPILTAVTGFVSAKLVPIFGSVVGVFGKVGDALGDLFSGFEDGPAAFAETMSEIFGPGSFDFFVGLGDQILLVKSWFTDTLVPALQSFGGFLTGTVIPAVGTFGGWLVRFQGWLIPLAAGVLAIVVALKAYAVVMGVVTKATAAWAAVQKALNVALAANLIGLVILAIVGLVAAIVVAYKRSETFRRIVDGALRAVGRVFVWLKDTAVAAFNWIKTKGIDFLVTVIRNSPLGLTVRGLFAAFGWLRDKIGGVVKWVGDKFAGFVDFFKRLPAAFSSANTRIKDALMSPFKAAFNAVARLWNSTVGRLSFTMPDIPGIPGRGTSWSMPTIPTMAVGGKFLSDGLVYGHKGETITPARVVRGERGYGGSSGPPIVINMSGVVGDKDAVARVVEDAVGRALRRGSVRVA